MHRMHYFDCCQDDASTVAVMEPSNFSTADDVAELHKEEDIFETLLWQPGADSFMDEETTAVTNNATLLTNG